VNSKGGIFNMSNQIKQIFEQATTAIVKEKNLDSVIYKSTSTQKIPSDSVEISSDVIDRMKVVSQ
jgi:hypothetical protein